MALPINIEDLLNKNRIESDRIEFKKGWNPKTVYHSVCAFANDIDNIGGGYILIGVEEENGIAKRPVCGIHENALDKIQREIHQYNQLLEPLYVPRLSVEDIDNKKILVIWVASGNNRPYSAPADVTAKLKKPVFYVRYGSSSIEAKGELLDQLRDTANRIPFDDRGNENISINDISPLLLKDYLVKVGSRLADSNFTGDMANILEQMDLLDGPVEKRQIKNVAAMMFSENPAKFFKETQVDIVVFPDGRENNPDNLMEVPPIKGPVPEIIANTLNYLRTNVIMERIVKPKDSEKSIRFFNFPFQALEESVVNALYHRNYQEREPVEITIEPNRISILSYSGPDRSISMQAIKEAKSLRSRRYRNRRLGEFLKELDLTEGRATGIPTIQKKLATNGSAAATIETDENRTYFLIDIPCHPDFVNDVLVNVPVDVLVESSEIQSVASKISQLCPSCVPVVSQLILKKMAVCLLRCKNEISGHQLLEDIEVTSYKQKKRKYIDKLLDMNLIRMTKPEKPTAKDQKYICTDLGLEIVGK
ncbi:MAG: putative DNA binding domain-containing protein [Bacteroidales bacterium]|nr:putative DNA binding domain-containing protein [Bacteroidales bacterium]